MKKNKPKPKFGLQIPPDDPQAYVLGGNNIPAELLLPEADWTDFLPDPEVQSKRMLETYDCTGFAILNAIELFMFRKYGEEVNYSDRWVGIIAETGKKQGNDPHTVCEAIRKDGLIPEEMLPFSDDLKTYEDYYSFKGANEKACYEEGQKWLKTYNFLHEWVYQPTQRDDEKKNNLKVALKYSPIPISVYAWATDERGIYVELGMQNHLTTNVSFKQFMGVFDSYEPFNKLVDQVPLYAKRIYIDKKLLTIEQKQSLWDLIKAFLFGQPEVIKQLEPILNPITMKTKQEILLEEIKSWIGKDASPENKASQDFSCAEGTSNILHRVFPEFPSGILSTANLFDELRKYPLFKTTLFPKPACVIISPRTKRTNGHSGFLIEKEKIISNNSKTGLMEQNYTFDSWIKEFKEKRGLHTIIFQLK